MSEVINLNSENPAAPAGYQNLSFAKGASTGTDPTTGLAIFPVSASVPIASDSQLGIVQPDGETITVNEDGVISSVGGSGTSQHTEPVAFNGDILFLNGDVLMLGVNY